MEELREDRIGQCFIPLFYEGFLPEFDPDHKSSYTTSSASSAQAMFSKLHPYRFLWYSALLFSLTQALITRGPGGTIEQTSLHNQFCALQSCLVLI